jgi:acetyltransferase-like isoleucine patch superfamily enzyme
MKNRKLFLRPLNRVLHLSARILPGGTSIRPFLHRLRGVKIHSNVFIGDDVYIENEYPERVEIGEGTQIGIRSMIIAHLRGPGKIIIGEKVWIGPNCVISGTYGRTLTIGEGSVIAASSVVTMDIPPGSFYSGERGKVIAKVGVPLTTETTYAQFVRGLVPLKEKSKEEH